MRSDARRVRVAIVGAGFSGTMLAIHLQRLGAAVTLIDRSGHFAQGLAYTTNEPVHLLNVPAGKMSAYPDAPAHFAEWLAARGLGDERTFAPRMVYRRYLEELFASCSENVRTVEDEAVSIAGGALRLGGGSVIQFDALVVAAGNLLPRPFAMLADSPLPYANDPWTGEGRATLAALAGQRGDVLVLGTGLTMIDTVLALDAQGFSGRVVALSRRGLLPRSHAPFATGGVVPPEQTTPRQLIRWARHESASNDWRAVVDSLRPVTASIWQGWTSGQRGRFLRHLRPWWDVHRHRIAPRVGKRIEELIGQGRLQVSAGRVEVVGDGRVTIRARGETGARALRVAGVVNCTGPQGDIRASADRFIQHLLESGTACTDRFGLGLDVDDGCRLVGRDGTVTGNLYAIGPMTRGTFWEVVAVPDIRVQARAIAERIAGVGAAEPASWQGVSTAR